MQNNSLSMKRRVLTLSLFLSIICFSCNNNVKNSKETQKEIIKKESVTNRPKKIEVTKKPDTVIDGKQVYYFGKESVKKREISLEEAINLFESGVNRANSCEELIRACATFDLNIKELSKKDSKVTLIEVEKRDDVRAIRRLSEEKSLTMCQTQKVNR